MTFYVSDEIKKSAVKCEKNYICLSRNEENVCKVISSVDDHIMHVYCAHVDKCVYKYPDEGRCLCTCPVRKEIYDKYDV